MNIDTRTYISGFMGKNIHLGVSGSIAAYKSLDLMRALQSSGAHVSATLTKSARQFLTPLTFQALGADPIYTDMFAPDGHTLGHLEPSRVSNVMVIAPCSANSLAKIAHGLADDMLSCQALAFDGPMIIAPAMNPKMWSAPATQENWNRLLLRGVHGVEPSLGNVACGDTGQGRLADLDEIFAATLKALSPQDFAGKKVLITLGPTRESWDAVRFWSNPSSGLMGSCLAVAAMLRGAEVTVVAGPCKIDLPSAINVVQVNTALEMYEACVDLWQSSDIGCLTAAVADFRPDPHGQEKFKKLDLDSLEITFSANPDILMTLGQNKQPGQFLIGFAAETSDLKASALAKLERKNLDIIVANNINKQGSGFSVSTNEVLVLDRTGRMEEWPQLPKSEVAWRIWDVLTQL